MGRRGENTGIYQRRANLRNSRKKLEGLLAANFQEGAQLVTLTYSTTTKAPSRKLAALQLVDWLRDVRDQQGQLRYIRATEQEQTSGGYPVHRIVLTLSAASIASIPALWKYGPTDITPIHEMATEDLSRLLMAQALESERVAVPCGRTWIPSLGLIRPERRTRT